MNEQLTVQVSFTQRFKQFKLESRIFFPAFSRLAFSASPVKQAIKMRFNGHHADYFKRRVNKPFKHHAVYPQRKMRKNAACRYRPGIERPDALEVVRRACVDGEVGNVTRVHSEIIATSRCRHKTVTGNQCAPSRQSRKKRQQTPSSLNQAPWHLFDITRISQYKSILVMYDVGHMSNIIEHRKHSQQLINANSKTTSDFGRTEDLTPHRHWCFSV